MTSLSAENVNPDSDLQVYKSNPIDRDNGQVRSIHLFWDFNLEVAHWVGRAGLVKGFGLKHVFSIG